MKKNFLILSILFVSHIFAQTTFQKAFYIDNYPTLSARDIKRTSDNGYMLLQQNRDSIALSKSDSVGTILWTKSISSGSMLITEALEQTSDDGYIIAGEGISNTTMYLFLIKTDKNGTIVWTKQCTDTTKTGNQKPNIYAHSIKQTKDHGFIISGIVRETFQPNICLIKTDSTGNIVWTKKYNSFAAGPSTENNYSPTSVLQTSDNGFILTSTGIQGILLKTDSIGEVQWAKELTYSKSTIYTRTSIIEKTHDNNYIISGTYNDNQGIECALLIKVNNMGTVIWSKMLGNIGNGHINNLKQTDDLGYLIVGSAENNKAFLIKTDAAGDLKWSRTFANGDAYSALQNSDKGYMVVGTTGKLSNKSFSSFMKLDSIGNGGACNDNILPILDSSIQLSYKNSSPLSLFWPAIDLTMNYSSNDKLATVIPCTLVGVSEELPSSDVLVYPNPSSGQFTFSKLTTGSTIEIFDILGNKIFVATTTNDDCTINIKEQSKGLYLYRIINRNKIIGTGKISLN